MKLSATPSLILTLGALTLVPFACSLDGVPNEVTYGADDDGSGPTDDGGDDPGPTTTTASTTENEPECPYQGPSPLDPTTLPACPNCSTGGAHCLPNGLVPADFVSQLDACDADSLCVPDYFIETTGLFIPPTCESVGGTEGRCLNRCIPEVAEQADLLPTDICADHEVCVPCYDPLTAEPTGSCELSCDPGPVEPPGTLPKCCGGNGTCVPPSAAGAQADKLGEDECPQDGGQLLCAPDVLLDTILVCGEHVI